MRIISLSAENVKRLKAVSITPTGDLVEVTGRNAQGKSSTLDAIWYALGGKRVAPTQPIRAGEESATIRLDLGELQITRRFRAQEDGAFTTDVVVENADGARFSKPQDILNALVGELSFDPLAFLDKKPDEQSALLQRLVPGFDFAASEGRERRAYEDRTDVNRKAKEARARAATMPAPTDPPAERTDEAPIRAELADAGRVSGERDAERRRREGERTTLQRMGVEATDLFAKAEQLRAEARAAEDRALELAEAVAERAGALDALPAVEPPVDTAALMERLQAAQTGNAALDQVAARDAVVKEAESHEARSIELTAAIEAEEAARQAAVAAAKMPVDGLGFGKGEVTLNGVPFAQASHAEQLRTSIAIAAAMNPKLRVVRVSDGSRLDSDAMRMLAEFAAEHDMQIWCETVESGRPSAIVIEDGLVQEAAHLALAAE